jgi:hydrogenase maturation protein HypF
MIKDEKIRLVSQIQGVVQGVGFRPFVYRLAVELGIYGKVLNNPAGVAVEAEADRPTLDEFLKRLRSEAPAAARIYSFEFSFHQPVGFNDFKICRSDDGGEKMFTLLSDIATCPDCLAEIQNPTERRFSYPFTNCTQCGPRFTIMTDIPYDRPNTSMQGFPLCTECEEEYGNPQDRRFHAQPLACPRCGPQLSYLLRNGVPVDCEDPLDRAVADIRSGALVAVKGLGGFHVMADAHNIEALERLREQKTREYKPFALMFPDMITLKKHCFVDAAEEILLTGAEAPIVLLKRRPESNLPDVIAPGNPRLGCMLPYTPLHFLMLAKLGNPVVATSGNLADEPMCIDENEAIHRLAFADAFLVHDRPIVRHADDSVVRVVDDQIVMLRRARGYAPLPFLTDRRLPRVLAVGGDLKNAIAISQHDCTVMSQHIGDLEASEAFESFQKVIADFKKIFSWTPDMVAADMHPGYFSHRYARSFAEAANIPLVEVQHHHAHMAACMFENRLEGDVLGVTWDGTGYGTDETIWGGEFLAGSYASFERVAHLLPFGLSGADAAVREPRRCALGVLSEIEDRAEDACLQEMFTPDELNVMTSMLATGMNTVRTTSAGRLFDAVSAISGICRRSTFEGQAAMMLEYAAEGELGKPYPFELRKMEGPSVIDWRPTILQIVQEKDVRVVARRFHATLVEMIRAVARNAGYGRVVLSGGVFQNALLLSSTRRALLNDGFEVYSHQRIPPNDGGIALGQILVAAHREMRD